MKRNEELRKELTVPDDSLEFFDALSPLQQYFVQFWAASKGRSPSAVLLEWQASPPSYAQRFTNYAFATLFTINRGKRGIQKHYCGWKVYCSLAASNVRYLLELVNTAFQFELQERPGCGFKDPIGAAIQTKAAQYVGQKNLTELEGLSTHGARLTKLVLGLGRVFGVLSANPEGHSPEVSQFALADSELSEEANDVVSSAVMHSALIRFAGTKPLDERDTKDFDYALHPIFSAFFACSYRRKRKMLLKADDLIQLVHSPREGIKAILLKANRSLSSPLPEQLSLFHGFYNEHP